MVLVTHVIISACTEEVLKAYAGHDNRMHCVARALCHMGCSQCAECHKAKNFTPGKEAASTKARPTPLPHGAQHSKPGEAAALEELWVWGQEEPRGWGHAAHGTAVSPPMAAHHAPTTATVRPLLCAAALHRAWVGFMDTKFLTLS